MSKCIRRESDVTPPCAEQCQGCSFMESMGEVNGKMKRYMLIHTPDGAKMQEHPDGAYVLFTEVPTELYVASELTEAMCKAFWVAFGADPNTLDEMVPRPFTGNGDLQMVPRWSAASERFKLQIAWEGMLAARGISRQSK